MKTFFKQNWRLYGTVSLFFVLTLAAVIFIFNFFSADTGEKNKVKKVYFVDNISIAHQSLIDQFNWKNKGEIEIVPVNLPFTKFSTNERKVLLARALRSKSDEIDIFAVDVIWVPRFARWAEPLESYFPLSHRTPMLTPAEASCFYEEKLVAIPLYIDIGIMYYRTDLLERFADPEGLEKQIQTSITWESLLKLKKETPEFTSPLYLYAAKNFEGLVCSFIEMLYEQEGTIIAGDSVQLNTPQARKSVQLMVDLVNKYDITAPDVVQFDEVNVYAFGLEKDALLMRGWPGLLRQSLTQTVVNVADTAKLRHLKRAPLPHFEGYPPAYVFGGWNMMISKQSRHKPEAVKFIKFMLQAQSQKLMFENGGYIPINELVYQDEAFMAKHPELRFYRQIMNNGIHRPYVVDYTKISDILSYYLQMAITQEITVEDALDNATHILTLKK